MKPESDPITDDEWLIRLIFHDRLKNGIVSTSAFEPRDGKEPEVTGISFYRLACLSDPSDSLAPFAPEKRGLYGIVRIPVTLVTDTLGMTLRPDPRSDVPGHVVIPEINITDYKQNKPRFTPIKLRLSEAASQNIIRLPILPSN